MRAVLALDEVDMSKHSGIMAEFRKRYLVSAMNRRIIDRDLTEEQVREIEAACKLPYVEDEDCPQIDPQRTPELWEEMMKALAERNRKMAQRMA